MAVSDRDVGSWHNFICLCDKIGGITARTGKTAEIRKFIDNYNGDLKVFLYLILPKATQRRYQMNRKRIFKLFASIFNVDSQDLNDKYSSNTTSTAGYLGKVISDCFSDSILNFPLKNKDTILSMRDIDNYLKLLTKETRESSQESLLKEIVSKCNKSDLKWFIREIDRDLKILVGNQTCLDAVHLNAYKIFQIKASLDYIVDNLDNLDNEIDNISMDMIPIKPMLAAPCKSYVAAFEKCKSGIIYAEIKYDGERVQIHFDGIKWKYYSRSLKPVQSYKMEEVEEYIKLSIPSAKTLILDSEILMIDKTTSKPLPFTSLGKHKRDSFKNSTSCLFVFDILYFNGKSLINLQLNERRKLLEREFNIIQNKVHLSTLNIIKTETDLKDLMHEMIEDNQEGLVLKDSKSIYAPNKRHWLKLKKDYLSSEGICADSADLVVLGVYKGSGKHGGKYSTFLMGALDSNNNIFVTVCKAHNGLSDKQIEDYTETLSSSMIQFNQNNIPQWLLINTSIYPDFIVKNPKKSPIFEISGFEFSESPAHTATDYNGQGFSIRFPRITKIRTDKKYKDATNLNELRDLIKISRNDPSSAINGNNKKNKKKRKQQTLTDMMEPPKKKRKIDDNNNDNNNDNKQDIDDMDDDDDNDINIIYNIDTNKISSPPPNLIDQPLSPKVMRDKRNICQYDDDCYRKKVDHFKEYQHPKKELNETNKIKQETKKNMEGIVKRKEELQNAANINKEKKLKKAKQEYDEMIKKAKNKYDELIQNVENQYKKILEKAQKEYQDKLVPIKQTEQFKLEKIEKKFHPNDT